jgi:hypothetical protein
VDRINAMLAASMFQAIIQMRRAAAWLLICCLCFAHPITVSAGTLSQALSVELLPIDVDPKRPERTTFGSLQLLSAFHLQSNDRRFGGLSGLSIGADSKLYAISDRGRWLSATISTDGNGALSKLVDWRIAPMLSPAKKPLTGRLADAEALTRTADGSFLVAFEGAHRIWRYPAPPETFHAPPSVLRMPPAVERAPGNSGLEGLTALPDGRLLALTEAFENPDRSLKGWLIDKRHWAELSYEPAKGFRVTDCAALDSGDVLVLERRYVPFGILSARIVLIKGGTLKPGARLIGKQLLRLEQPLAAENYEALAVQRTRQGTSVFIASDDNYGWFQQTLLLQFLLPDGEH